MKNDHLGAVEKKMSSMPVRVAISGAEQLAAEDAALDILLEELSTIAEKYDMEQGLYIRGEEGEELRRAVRRWMNKLTASTP